MVFIDSVAVGTFRQTFPRFSFYGLRANLGHFCLSGRTGGSLSSVEFACDKAHNPLEQRNTNVMKRIFHPVPFCTVGDHSNL